MTIHATSDEVSIAIADAINYWRLVIKRAENHADCRQILKEAKVELIDLLKVDGTVHPGSHAAAQASVTALFKEWAEEYGLDGVDGVDGATKPEILLIEPGELVRAAEELRNILSVSGLFYERGVPVCIAKRAGDKLPFAFPLTKNSVVRAADKLCQPIKAGEKATLPNRVAELYLDLTGEWQLPPLRAISTAPVLSSDGSIRDGSGYDKKTGLYLHDVPKLNILTKPNKDDAEHALFTLRKTFATFPFSDAEMAKHGEVKRIDHSKKIGSDESAFLNGLLTAICRQSLPLAPGLMLNAPTHSGAGTGKGLIARAISMLAYGCAPHPFTKGDGPQETDKRLAAALIEGRPMVYLDNANQTLLKSDTLASAITEPTCQIRPLGKSQMIELEVGSFFIVTGNGLSITEDLVRRFVNSRLDAKMENPEFRKFAPGFIDTIKDRRIELLEAALTIWRWGRQQAEANLEHGEALGSFEVWAKWVRDPLLTLGCSDPVVRLKEIKAHDPSRQRAGDLFASWWEHHQSNPVKVSELNQKVIEVLDPGHKRTLNWHAARVAEFVGTRQSGFVLEIFDLPGAGKRGTEYCLKMTEEHPDNEKPPFDAPQPPASPASPATGEEKPIKSDHSNDDQLAGGFDHPQTIRTTRRSGPPADHPQGSGQISSEQNQTINVASAGSAGGAGGFDHTSNGFFNGEPTRCLQCGKPLGPGSREITVRSTGTGQLVSIHEDCLTSWQSQQPIIVSTRVTVREIPHPAISAGPHDNLDDFPMKREENHDD